VNYEKTFICGIERFLDFSYHQPRDCRKGNSYLLNMRGKIFYDWSDNVYDESLQFKDKEQLGSEAYDIAIIGAGVVGCALAYKLSQFKLKTLLIDKNYDIGEGTSKGSSAIVHTGFDAPVGTLESKLVTQASLEWPDFSKRLKIPYDPCGALLIALNDEQLAQLDKIHKKALDNGVDDVVLVSANEASTLETNISPDVRGGMLIPREALGDPFTMSVACAEVALRNGVDIILGSPVIGVEEANDKIKKLLTSRGHRISTRMIVNVAGLGSRKLADSYGGDPFDINPRRGQFLIFDKYSRSKVDRILLPIPTSHSKGVLVIPTIFGNLMAGPTAEDFPLDYECAKDTTCEGLEGISNQVTGMLPDMKSQPVISTFSGVRCNCEQGSYLIRYNDGHKGIVTVTGVRSTGFTSSPALAEYMIEGISTNMDLKLDRDPHAIDSRPDSSWPGWWHKPFHEEDRVKKQPEYGHMVCYCENISHGEIIDALESPLKPRTLDAIKRRTRVQTGRCQGFNCQVHIAEAISEHCGIPLDKITKSGPGSEVIAKKRIP
jgi:glycerol-3-phosphate dehydrogenase